MLLKACALGSCHFHSSSLGNRMGCFGVPLLKFHNYMVNLSLGEDNKYFCEIKGFYLVESYVFFILGVVKKCETGMGCIVRPYMFMCIYLL